jgi:4-amino-4-deoxy-L-arabinose transferase-like glycosyltransferase
MKPLTLAIVLLGLAYGLTAYPLLDPDEGRNAEVAREMAATNDYVLPRLDGLPYPDKPVLFFATAAAAMEVLGPTALAARLPSLAFTLATLAVVAWFARRRSGGDAAWTATVALGASPLALGFARTVIFDSALTFFVVVAVVAFYQAMPDREPAAGSRMRGEGGWGWSAAAWAAMALAVLTKGPIGLALPLMIVVPYSLWRRNARVVWAPAGPLLFAALLLPWLMLMSGRVPGFLHHALVTETAVRLTTPALQRTGPFWYFFPIVLVGALPWTVVALAGVLPRAFHRGPDGRADPYLVLLASWILVPLLFFSLSQSKRPQYVLPLVPAVALLVAHLWQARARPAGARVAGGVLIVMGGLIASTPWLLPQLLPVTPAVREAVRQTALGLSSVTVVCGTVALAFGERYPVALLTLSLPVAAVPVTGLGLMRQIGRERSTAELALAIGRTLPTGADVAAIGAFPLSLPFYLRRPVLLATATGAELTSNFLTKDVARWRLVPDSPLRPADWWLEAVRQCGSVRIFVTRADDAAIRTVLAAQVPLLVETPRYAAYGPCVRSDLAHVEKRQQLNAEGAESTENAEKDTQVGAPVDLFSAPSASSAVELFPKPDRAP